MFAQAVEVAAQRGRVPVIASPADGNATFGLRTLYRKELRVLGVNTGFLDSTACAALLTEMSPWFDSGRFRVHPGQPCPLSDAADAYLRVAAGNARVVLRPGDDQIAAPGS